MTRYHYPPGGEERYQCRLNGFDRSAAQSNPDTCLDILSQLIEAYPGDFGLCVRAAALAVEDQEMTAAEKLQVLRDALAMVDRSHVWPHDCNAKTVRRTRQVAHFCQREGEPQLGIDWLKTGEATCQGTAALTVCRRQHESALATARPVVRRYADNPLTRRLLRETALAPVALPNRPAASAPTLGIAQDLAR